MNENAAAGAPRTIDRRTVVKGAAWSVPAIAAAVAMPLAAASGETKDVDVRLSFTNAVDTSVSDIGHKLVDGIIGALGALNPGGIPGIAFSAALGVLKTGLNAAVSLGTSLLDVSIKYPDTLVATNNGLGVLRAGQTITGTLTYDSNLVDLSVTTIAGLELLGTGGTRTFTYTLPADVAAGGQIFAQKLRYNPLSLTVNLAGTATKSSTATALLTSVDANPAGNTASASIGITAKVLSALAGLLATFQTATGITLPTIDIDLT